METGGRSPLVLDIDADTRGLERSLADTAQVGLQFSRLLASSFTDVAVKGKNLGDVVGNLGQRLSQMALQAALRPVEQGLGQIISGLMTSGVGTGGGGTSQAGGIDRFPLFGGGNAAPPAPIVFNVAATDVESFRRSETQLAAMVARAASLGQRNL